MSTIWLVLKNEIITKLQQKSFLFAAFGLPIIGMLFYLLAATVTNNAGGFAGDLARSALEPGQLPPAGFIDRSGLVAVIPQVEGGAPLVSYPDEEAARQALTRNEIRAYYIIPADFITSGRVIFVPSAENSLNDLTHQAVRWLLTVNLVGGDETLAAHLDDPLQIEPVSLAPEPQRDRDNPLTFLLPYTVTVLFYIVIFGTASHNISSITTEKENRVIEILLTSVAPQKMFTGKILGLGIVGLLQAGVWIGISYLLLRLSDHTFDLPPEFRLPPTLVAWGLLFFILGYAVYAGLMAGIGALAPNLREAAQAAFVVNTPLLLALILIGLFIEDPDGPLSIAFSLFPLTAPVVMMTRLAATAVPLWQILLAQALLVLTIFGIIRLTTRLFQAQTLLSGQPFKLWRFFKVLLGRL